VSLLGIFGIYPNVFRVLFSCVAVVGLNMGVPLVGIKYPRLCCSVGRYHKGRIFYFLCFGPNEIKPRGSQSEIDEAPISAAEFRYTNQGLLGPGRNSWRIHGHQHFNLDFATVGPVCISTWYEVELLKLLKILCVYFTLYLVPSNHGYQSTDDHNLGVFLYAPYFLPLIPPNSLPSFSKVSKTGSAKRRGFLLAGYNL
jgi:hypothetical protein